MTEENRVLNKIIKSVGGECRVKYLAVCNLCNWIWSFEAHYKKTNSLRGLTCPECEK